MVIGIPGPGKRTAGGSRGVLAPSARPFRPDYNNRLLRRRSRFRGGSSGVGGGRVRVSSGSARISSSARVSGGIDRRIGGSSSGITSRFSGSGSGIRSSSSGVGGLILLGATGADQQGNRNGAPDLCIHRQLPQFVSENYKCNCATSVVACADFSGIARVSKGRHFATTACSGYPLGLHSTSHQWRKRHWPSSTANTSRQSWRGLIGL